LAPESGDENEDADEQGNDCDDDPDGQDENDDVNSRPHGKLKNQLAACGATQIREIASSTYRSETRLMNPRATSRPKNSAMNPVPLLWSEALWYFL